jgi:glycolate oxidase iron-sulfur subunit
MEGARAEVVAQLPDAAIAVRRTVFGRAIRIRGLVTAASWMAAGAQRVGIASQLPGALGRLSGLRPIPIPVPSTKGKSWEPQGTPVGTVGLLSGCVMDPWFSQVHVALIQTLRLAGYRVVAPREQTCCGALAAHEGAAYDAAAMAERNVAAFAGCETVVADAAGCSAHLKDYGHWGGGSPAPKVLDATELIASLIADGSLPILEQSRGPVAVQDPCHLRHAQRIVEEPRMILRAAGYDPIEIDSHGICCGAAGAYQLKHPDASAELGRAKANQVLASAAPIVASANPGCEMQLRSYLGDAVRVTHPVELYWEAASSRESRVQRQER